ncbi:hemolysin-III related-domain-containing protein [Podospora australis]|uniref:Hemolysin-III related-domain-containing protein n=1 Tax=Podospora australis TaxID=1536484 RepID=A0AAN6WYM6_9PEZI|nr:hemolysin-III related-domain-containing protein [Podospora australis]
MVPKTRSSGRSTETSTSSAAAPGPDPNPNPRARSSNTTTKKTSRPSVTDTVTDSLVSAAKTAEAKIEELLHVHWDDLDPWRRDNAFIRTGYRPTSNSFHKSFASLRYLHNESVNIWSHLLGAILFSVGGTYLYYLIRPRYASASSADVVVFACFFLGAFLCLGMSATYHTLSNHSPDVAKWGNKLDYTGIVCLILGSYVPAMYYGFKCHPGLLKMYLSTICALGIGCITVSWFEHFRTPEWRPYRAAMFVGLGLSGVLPIIHALVFLYSYGELNQRMGLSWVILQGGMYIFGAFLYAARWPERHYPGKFDIFGSSHQIFHIFVLLAAATHLYGMVKAFDYHHSSGMGAIKC